MGISGGGVSNSSSSGVNGSAQAWAQPIAQGAANMGTAIQQQAQPLTNGLTNMMSSTIPDLYNSAQGNQQMIQGNANFYNSLVPGMADAFGQNYNNMQGLAGQVG